MCSCTPDFFFRGDTALHQASLNGYKDIVDVLIAKGELIDFLLVMPDVVVLPQFWTFLLVV